MFGYVRFYKPQLRFCEYNQYKAVYCTLCSKLGKEYGIHARALLNYDFTFVAMLHMAVNKEPVCYKVGRCVFSPFKKCTFCTGESGAFSVTAAMTAAMFYYKAVDNARDSGFFGKAAWNAVKLFAVPMRNKARKRYPAVEDIISRCMDMQYAVEHGNDNSVDASAEPSAVMIRELGKLLSEDIATQRILSDFGYYFGRWIYLIDAFDDLEKDIKSGSYNTFALKFSLTEKDIKKDSERLAQAREYANECLNMTVARAIKAFNLLDTGEFAPIFENILMLGLGEAQRKALHEKELQQNERPL